MLKPLVCVVWSSAAEWRFIWVIMDLIPSRICMRIMLDLHERRPVC